MTTRDGIPREATEGSLLHKPFQHAPGIDPIETILAGDSQHLLFRDGFLVDGTLGRQACKLTVSRYVGGADTPGLKFPYGASPDGTTDDTRAFANLAVQSSLRVVVAQRHEPSTEAIQPYDNYYGPLLLHTADVHDLTGSPRLSLLMDKETYLHERPQPAGLTLISAYFEYFRTTYANRVVGTVDEVRPVLQAAAERMRLNPADTDTVITRAMARLEAAERGEGPRSRQLEPPVLPRGRVATVFSKLRLSRA